MATNVWSSISNDAATTCNWNLFSWQEQELEQPPHKQKTQQKEYTDSDFAKDMQGLSFQERQHATEDIHLVADDVNETKDFVKEKVGRVKEVLKNVTKQQKVQRDAWDRAVFLRPSMANDYDHHLTFLRAKHYDPYDAAMLIFGFYETKRKLWGDEYLTRRISWNDLSEATKAVYRDAHIMYITRNVEEPCRRVSYNRGSIREPDLDPMELMRAVMYSFMANAFGNKEVQRKGLISITDLRGQWKMSPLQIMEQSKVFVPMMETFPVRNVALHFIVDGTDRTAVARNIQSQLSRNRRIRSRVHAGSWMEIQYSLRRYGIDIGADWLEGDIEGSPFSSQSIDDASQEYIRNENEWKRNETPYCDPSSDFALYPNSQDIIMGNNRKIALLWHGNVTYTALIRQYCAGYGIVNSKPEKTAIAKEIVHRLKVEFQARFLSRKENVGWETISDEEARCKVSQSLRDEYRKRSKQAFH